MAVQQAGNMLRVDGIFVARLSLHAKRRMAERGVDAGEVVEALRSPVQLVYDGERDVYLSLGPNGVAVVYAERGRVLEVVTVLRRREYEALLTRLGPRRYRVIY